MTTTDPYATVFWGEGYGITPDFLNNGQRFVQAQMTDQVLQYLTGAIDATIARPDPMFTGQNGANPPTIRAYALSTGAAYLRQGSANHKIQIAPGTLLQKIANSDGLGSTLVPYTFAGTEEWTLTNGDATLPRVDLLQMKLEYITDTPAPTDFQDAVSRVLTTNPLLVTKRRIQCTLSVKTGTPGATPTFGVADAGFVVVGSVLVGNGWTTAGNAPIMGLDTAATGNAVVHDQRMPIGVREYTVDPSQFKLITQWVFSDNFASVSSTNATNRMLVVCPAVHGRLVGVSVHHTTTLATVILGQCSGIVEVASFASRITINGNPVGDEITPFYQFEDQQSPSAGPTTDQVSNGIGCPLWANGRRMLIERMRLFSAGSVPAERLVLSVASGANASKVGAVTFYIAEGL